MTELLLTSPTEALPNPRRRRRPTPRFKPSLALQLDAIHGCPAMQLPSEHLARTVWAYAERLDVSTAEAKHTSLGRPAYQPRHKLAVWIYASLIGVHHATELARRLKTDAALRFLSGGYEFSERTLGRFRSDNGALFRAALDETVKMAAAAKIVKPEELAIDSVRLRAHASGKAARTLERSRRRLVELEKVDATKLDKNARAKHDAKVAKHRAAVEKCEREGRTNYVETCESAGLLKFPDGASAPGHRVTVAAAGVTERIVVAVLIDADNTDYGKLAPTVADAVATLRKAGIPDGTRIQVAADAGYHSEKDLVFAVENRKWIDILIRGETAAKALDKKTSKHFTHADFRFDGDVATCPAGRTMLGPWKSADGSLRWEGQGCADCPKRPQCTDSKKGRQIALRPTLEAARAAMSERMAQPDAETRYAQRIATVEPVFASVESVHRFRRVSSRKTSTVHAEILLKLLAHNIARLSAARRRLLLFFVAV